MRGDLSTRYGGADSNFNGVLYQQGRVFLDTDGNAQTRITNDWQDTAGRDVIGAGVAAIPAEEPDSFRISAADLAAGEVKLTVEPGRVWADGLLVRLDDAPPITRLATYFGPPIQDPGFDESTIAAGERDAVILELLRTEVNAFQLPDTLIEAALGGVDTSERVSTSMRFRLLRMSPGDDCDNLGDKLADDFSQKGKLKVTLEPTTVTAGDCPVVEGGGYSGFEHHLYRIEIAETDAAARMFKWSRFNGGLVGRGVFDAPTQRVTITGNLTPIVTSNLTDFYLEAVEWDASQGRWRVTYGAGVTLAGDQLVLPAAATFGVIPAPGAAVFFRLWDGIRALSNFLVSANPAELLDGIRLEFEPDAPGRYVPEDHWTFPVRAGEIGNPQVLIDSAPPEGIHYHRVPLAVLNWDGSPDLTAVEGTIEDCRRIVQPLTKVSTCCTYRVGDGLVSHGDYESIGIALEHLPDEGGEICVLPGTYLENVLIDHKTNVKISGCGSRSKVISPPAAGGSADPVFHIKNSSGIRLEHLAVEADVTGIGILLEGGAQPSVAVHAVARRRVWDIALIDLSIHAATRSAIECRDSQHVLIQDCRVAMADAATSWPGIFFVGRDSSIERNEVRVAVGRRPLSESGPITAVAGLGGIQLGGTCERVRVLENLIQGGLGNGVTLGSVSLVNEAGDDDGKLIGWAVNADDPCNPCLPGDGVIVDPGGDDGGRLVSAGPLEEITIGRNRILDMGMNGIGVIGFFDLESSREVVTVNRLSIVENEIRRCLKRSLEPIRDGMLDAVGYGGVSLADVEHLTIRANVIEENGADYLEPVCGVFLLHGEGVDISSNRIVNNGAKTKERPSRAGHGPRGGIYIVGCISPGATGIDRRSGGTTALPALRVEENIVSAPLGRALTAAALGSVSVHGNYLATMGAVSEARVSLLSPVTVKILDLGSSVGVGATFRTHADLADGNHGASLARATSDESGMASLQALGRYVRLSGDGRVLFSDNQVSVELADVERMMMSASIAIYSLDDVGFHSNQCTEKLSGQRMLSQAMLFGVSLRASDNRFSEGLLDVIYSAITLGFMNMTTNNQATHCLLILPHGDPLVIDQPNTIILGALSPKICDRFGKLFGAFGTRLMAGGNQ